MAEKALQAANSQHTVLPTQATGSALVVRLAEQISAIDAEIADVLLSMPGFGPVLAATFLATIGGNLDGFDSVDRLASVARLAPVPHDPGRISGNLHRPRRFNRRLLRTCYLAALSSLKTASHPEPTTTGNAARESPTNRRSSPPPAAASTSSGPCSETTPPIRNQCHVSPLRCYASQCLAVGASLAMTMQVFLVVS